MNHLTLLRSSALHSSSYQHFDHLASCRSRVAPVHPGIVFLGEMDRHDAVHAGPHDLSELLRIVELRTISARQNSLGHGVAQKTVGVLFGISALELLPA